MANARKPMMVDVKGKSSNGMTNRQTKFVYDVKTKAEAKQKAEARCGKAFGLVKSKTKVR